LAHHQLVPDKVKEFGWDQLEIHIRAEMDIKVFLMVLPGLKVKIKIFISKHMFLMTSQSK